MARSTLAFQWVRARPAVRSWSENGSFIYEVDLYLTRFPDLDQPLWGMRYVHSYLEESIAVDVVDCAW